MSVMWSLWHSSLLECWVKDCYPLQPDGEKKFYLEVITLHGSNFAKHKKSIRMSHLQKKKYKNKKGCKYHREQFSHRVVCIIVLTILMKILNVSLCGFVLLSCLSSSLWKAVTNLPASWISVKTIVIITQLCYIDTCSFVHSEL